MIINSILSKKKGNNFLSPLDILYFALITVKESIIK